MNAHSFLKALTSSHIFFRSRPLGDFPFPLPFPDNVAIVASSSALTSFASAACQLLISLILGLIGPHTKEYTATYLIRPPSFRIKRGIQHALVAHHPRRVPDPRRTHLVARQREQPLQDVVNREVRRAAYKNALCFLVGGGGVRELSDYLDEGVCFACACGIFLVVNGQDGDEGGGDTWWPVNARYFGRCECEFDGVFLALVKRRVEKCDVLDASSRRWR